MTSPQITIITVVYNCIGYIEKTIQSVISQSYPNIQYIIIDGGSNDGTIDIIKKYENKIDKWLSEPDKGIYDAMNKGIIVSSGEWILFLNAGDKFHSKGVLDRISSLLKDCDVLYGNTCIAKDEVNTIIRKAYPIHLDWKVIPYCHQSVFIKRTLLAENLFNISYKIAADYDQYFKLKNIGVYFKLTDEIISIYDNNGFSHHNNNIQLNEYEKISLENNIGVISIIKIKLYFFLKHILNKL